MRHFIALALLVGAGLCGTAFAQGAGPAVAPVASPTGTAATTNATSQAAQPKPADQAPSTKDEKKDGGQSPGPVSKDDNKK
jgi:hypothetical protein